MTKVLVIADAAWVLNEVRGALSDPEYELVEHDNPRTLVERATEVEPDVVVADLQVGSMGGMAITRAVRQAAALGEIPETPVVILLDRSADTFLARRAGAAAWVPKPINPFELRDAIEASLQSPVEQ